MASVLVIDDSKFLCAVLRDTFQKAGYKITTANTIIEGVKYLKMETPNIIFLDINLPGTVQGNEACKMLKSSSSAGNIPIILMSGATDEEMRAKQAECGAEGYLCKPFTPKHILEWMKTNASLVEASA